MTISATRRSGSMHGKRYQALLTTIVVALPVIMVLVLQLTEGRRITKQTHPRHQQRRRREKTSRAGVGRDFTEFFYVISGIITCIIAPVFVSFVHSLYTDPGVPQLTRTAWSVLKKKLLSYLGQREKNDSRPSSTIEHLPADDDPSSFGVPRAERYFGTTDGNGETNDSSELHDEFHAPLLNPKPSVAHEYHRHASFDDLMDDNNLYRKGSRTNHPTSHHTMQCLDELLGNRRYFSTTCRPHDDDNRVEHEPLGKLVMQKGVISGIPLAGYRLDSDPERPVRGRWDSSGDSEPLTGRTSTEVASIAEEGIYKEGVRSKRSRKTTNNFARRRMERSHEKRDSGIDDHAISLQ